MLTDMLVGGCFHPVRRTWIGALLLLATVSTTPGFAASSLRDVLSPEEFQRAGLSKLTAEELAYLSARVVPAPVQPAAPVAVVTELPRGEAAFGREEQLQRAVAKTQQVPDEIRSQVQGAFGGWSGRTIFTLANGQVWQQTEPGDFVVQLSSPAVVIRKGRFGAFYLGVVGYGSQTKVKRIK